MLDSIVLTVMALILIVVAVYAVVGILYSMMIRRVINELSKILKDRTE